jgi:hypothetical protein
MDLLSGILQDIKSSFGHDFWLGVFLPMLTFVGVNLALYLEVFQHGVGAALAAFGGVPLQTQVLLVLAALIVVIVLAYLIYNLPYLTRLFEGYWPPMMAYRILCNDVKREGVKARSGLVSWLFSSVPLHKIRYAICKEVRIPELRTNLYKREMEDLNDKMEDLNDKKSDPKLNEEQKHSIEEQKRSIEQKLETFYPQEYFKPLRPTRLGNILLATEAYLYKRYGIDYEVIWPRLRTKLPAEVIAALENSKTQRDFMVLTSALAWTFSPIWCLSLAICTTNWQLFLWCALGWPLAWICYKNALQSTIAYSEQLKALFDFNRGEFFKALNRRMPPNIEEERKEWEHIARFFKTYSFELPPNPPEPDKPKGWDQVAIALAEYIKQLTPPAQ